MMVHSARWTADPLPKGWSKLIRSGVLNAISLGATAMSTAWARAAAQTSSRRLGADIDRLRAEIVHLEEEMAIKDRRWVRHSPRRRPHYDPIQRMRILRLRAARGWTISQTADRFLVTEMTIMNWMRRLDEGGEAALVQLEEPVNKYPDFVAYLVRHLKVLSPALGKKRIADMMARAGLHLSASTVGRMLQRDPYKDDSDIAVPVSATDRRLRAKRPDHVWHVDLTAIPTSGGLWAPWFPFAKLQRWPFCWWAAVAVDHASRQFVGFALFKKRPTAVQVCSFLGRAIRQARSTPKYIITDKGKEFFCWPFKNWCRRRGISPRYGAIGQHGSITVVERFIRSMKTECTRRILVPYRVEEMRRELPDYECWYNDYRPHTGLGGRTPAEVYHVRVRSSHAGAALTR